MDANAPALTSAALMMPPNVMSPPSVLCRVWRRKGSLALTVASGFSSPAKSRPSQTKTLVVRRKIPKHSKGLWKGAHMQTLSHQLQDSGPQQATTKLQAAHMGLCTFIGPSPAAFAEDIAVTSPGLGTVCDSGYEPSQPHAACNGAQKSVDK